MKNESEPLKFLTHDHLLSFCLFVIFRHTQQFFNDSSQFLLVEECKTNMIPILMHQMGISTNQVSSVVLRPKKLEIPPLTYICLGASDGV
jgi:hypothetical protein